MFILLLLVSQYTYFVYFYKKHTLNKIHLFHFPILTNFVTRYIIKVGKHFFYSLEVTNDLFN